VGWEGALTGLGAGCGGGGRWKERKKRLVESAMPAARSTAHAQAASITQPRWFLACLLRNKRGRERMKGGCFEEILEKGEEGGGFRASLWI
jgi:hypothetical protein